MRQESEPEFFYKLDGFPVIQNEATAAIVAALDRAFVAGRAYKGILAHITLGWDFKDAPVQLVCRRAVHPVERALCAALLAATYEERSSAFGEFYDLHEMARKRGRRGEPRIVAKVRALTTALAVAVVEAQEQAVVMPPIEQMIQDALREVEARAQAG